MINWKEYRVKIEKRSLSEASASWHSLESMEILIEKRIINQFINFQYGVSMYLEVTIY